jgi:putative flippase GtrA
MRKLLSMITLDTQMVRFFITGITSNGIGYFIYLALTLLMGIGHKTAMTTLYVLSALINFFVNRRWTFRSTGAIGYGLGRFVLVTSIGYLLNLLGLYAFVDVAGFPHELVQACAILVMAGYFFIANKYYIHAP